MAALEHQAQPTCPDCGSTVTIVRQVSKNGVEQHECAFCGERFWVARTG